MRRQQLGRAEDAHVPEELGADLVLPALAPVVLDVDRTQAPAMREHREERVRFVIGMRGRLHERAGHVQLADREAERHVAAVLVDDREVLAVLRQEIPIAGAEEQGHEQCSNT